jgi:hypothetical protein
VDGKCTESDFGIYIAESSKRGKNHYVGILTVEEFQKKNYSKIRR